MKIFHGNILKVAAYKRESYKITPNCKLLFCNPTLLIWLWSLVLTCCWPLHRWEATHLAFSFPFYNRSYSEVHCLKTRLKLWCHFGMNMYQKLCRVVVVVMTMVVVNFAYMHCGSLLLFPMRNRQLLYTVQVWCRAPSDGPACRAWPGLCTRSTKSGLRAARLHSCSLSRKRWQICKVWDAYS